MSKPVNLKIVTTGAGIAGLSAASALLKKNPNHDVTLLERHGETNLPGIAIGVISNCCRSLDYLGLYDKVSDRCRSNPQARYFRRWENGTVLMQHTPIDSDKLFSYPTYNILRGDLYHILKEGALAHGAKIRFNAKVRHIDIDTPAVELGDGQRIEYDLILAADGIAQIASKAMIMANFDLGVNSVARAQLFPQCHKKTATYDIRFIAIPEERIRSDPLTSSLLDSRSFWFGPGKAIAAGQVQIGDKIEYCTDWSTIVEEKQGIPLGITFQNTDPGLLLKRFEGWDPKVLRTLHHIKEMGGKFNQWCLTSQQHPSQWFSDNGRVILFGDAIRADLLFSGQGAAMAIEDSICLAECLSRASGRLEMLQFVQAWQKIRQPRTDFIQKQIRLFKTMFHMPDGPAQRAQDEKWTNSPGGADFRDLWNGQHIDDPPQDSIDPMCQPYLAGHDVLSHANRKLDECFGSTSHDTSGSEEDANAWEMNSTFHPQPKL